jgi:hypothetical protein
VIQFLSNDSKATIQGTNGASTLGFGTGAFLVEVVARWAGATQGLSGLFQTSATTTAFSLFGDMAGHVAATEANGAYAVVSTNANLGTGTNHLVAARRSGSGATTTLELRVDGLADNSATGANYAQDLQATAAGQIGPAPDLGIAELVVVKGTTSADDLAHLEAYLKAKYLLP